MSFELDRKGINSRFFIVADRLIGSGFDKMWRTDKEFAKDIGISKNFMSAVRNGKEGRNVSFKMIVALQNLAGDRVDVREILMEDYIENNRPKVPDGHVIISMDSLNKILAFQEMSFIEVKKNIDKKNPYT